MRDQAARLAHGQYVAARVVAITRRQSQTGRIDNLLDDMAVQVIRRRGHDTVGVGRGDLLAFRVVLVARGKRQAVRVQRSA